MRPYIAPGALARIAALCFCAGLGIVCAQTEPLVQDGPGAIRTLRDTPLLRSADGRKQLQYLVSCALSPQQAVRYNVDGQSIVLRGSMALAPAWFDTALDSLAQRRVSACILARTNYFGQRVEISMRAHWPDAPPALRTDAQEERDFPRMEGQFFGNLFSAAPSAYVCTPPLPDANAEREQARWAASHKRICAQSDGQDAQRSACHFVRLGNCTASQLLQDGVDYSDSAISVYLPGEQKTDPAH